VNGANVQSNRKEKKMTEQSLNDILSLPDSILGNIPLDGVRGGLYHEFTTARAAAIRHFIKHIVEQAPIIQAAEKEYKNFETVVADKSVTLRSKEDGTVHNFEDHHQALQWLADQYRQKQENVA
jgi:hypothetical protein